VSFLRILPCSVTATQHFDVITFVDTYHCALTLDHSFCRLPPQPGARNAQVRVDAVAALRNLVEAFDDDHLDSIKPLLPELLNLLFGLMVEVVRRPFGLPLA